MVLLLFVFVFILYVFLLCYYWHWKAGGVLVYYMSNLYDTKRYFYMQADPISVCIFCQYCQAILTWDRSQIRSHSTLVCASDLVPFPISLNSPAENLPALWNHENNCTGHQNSWIMVVFANIGNVNSPSEVVDRVMTGFTTKIEVVA